MELKQYMKKIMFGVMALAIFSSITFGALLAYQAISGSASGTVEQGLETVYTDATCGSTADAGITWDLGTLHGNDAVNITFDETNRANQNAVGVFAVIVSSNDTLVCGVEVNNFAFYPSADGLITSTDSHATDGAVLAMNCLASGLNEITYTGTSNTAINAGVTMTPEIDFSLNPLFANQELDFVIRYN